ncbi:MULTISPECIES: hypothetical protein [unclassified Bartonella]|uniref:hypothetical protein n=1 Tax=unclassified Bartonella TaxID=2645622 RepID=UPI0035CE8B2D
MLRLRPLRVTISKARGWSQRITPVVCSPVPTNETAKPAVLANDIISTGRVPFSHRQRLGQAIQTKFHPASLQELSVNRLCIKPLYIFIRKIVRRITLG